MFGSGIVFAISVSSVITIFLKNQAEINNFVLFRWEALDERKYSKNFCRIQTTDSLLRQRYYFLFEPIHSCEMGKE